MTVIEGIVKPDGTLELQKKVPLKAGRVQVTITPIPDLPADDEFWQMMHNIWQNQKARGHIPRSAEQVEAERSLLREEWEERMQGIQLMQEEARKLREQNT